MNRGMRLRELLRACEQDDWPEEVLGSDVEILGLSEDSRRIKPGFLFAAFPGSESDGRAFIPDALARGAGAILTTPDVISCDDRVVWIQTAEPRALFAQMASAWFPRRPERITAITGTNGKSSTAYFLRQLWSRLGLSAAAIGTLGVIRETGLDGDASLTTLAPLTLHRLLQELADEGIERVALEASSHGLSQHRLDGLCFEAAAFTGFSQDHLDYHHDMESYGQAKLLLFRERLARGSVAVLNADMRLYDQARAIAKKTASRVISIGFRKDADFFLSSLTPSAQGQQVECFYQGERFAFDLPLIGEFQASNAVMAAALAIAEGFEAARVFPLLSSLKTVPGRLQEAGRLGNGARVYIDYAHTPDALANVLDAARPHAQGRLVVLFGCGGDRDRSKRAQMGAIAAEKADHIVITDDNPRKENAADIRQEILASCPDAEEIGDRRDAILHAVACLESGDILIIAGKGQEQFQLRGSESIPFCDLSEAQAAIGALQERQES